MSEFCGAIKIKEVLNKFSKHNVVSLGKCNHHLIKKTKYSQQSKVFIYPFFIVRNSELLPVIPSKTMFCLPKII